MSSKLRRLFKPWIWNRVGFGGTCRKRVVMIKNNNPSMARLGLEWIFPFGLESGLLYSISSKRKLT